jgi:hypothetical protein
MPVTFCPAANTKIEPYGAERTFGDRNSAWLFQKTYRDERPIVEHLQSSFGRGGSQPAPVTACNNGFVDTLVDAYSRHHALVIRPDDVWTCILTQFSLFVNGKGRAERLRHLFVAHEGKRKLTITTVGTRHSVDFGALAREMTEKIHENVVDPELRAWILPDFSTTTENDTVVASTIMMATLKAYFKYSMMLMCGLPRVTLLGTLDDWTRILHRVDKLVLYGPETTAWRNLLRPVLARFVKAFEPGYADSAENLDFWQRVAHRESGGSGPTYLSGWITAFCAFGDSGQWLGSKGSLEKTETHGMHCELRSSYMSNLTLSQTRRTIRLVPSSTSQSPRV